MRRGRAHAALVAAAVALWWLRPRGPVLPARPGDPASWLAWLHRVPLPVALTVALDGLGWLLVGWVGLATVLVVAARGNGRAGRLAGRLATWLTPRLARRVAVSLLGGALVPAALLPAPAWAAGGAAPPGSSSPWPSLDWPSAVPAHRTAPPSPGSRRIPAAPPPAVAVSGAAESAAVVVRPGDTLWRIAAAHLPAGSPDAAVATAWPRWYAANAPQIGPDPNLIRPGEVLHPPPAASDPQENR